MEYHPEEYWSEVAERIDAREDGNVLAGDDSPFYRYKRKKFLSLLNEVPFKGKKVLEIGSGPGGNLLEVLKHKPAELNAADISNTMISIARKNVKNKDVHFTKINGRELPFENQCMDIVFSATVLQHNTDELMMQDLLREMCRVSRDKVILFERIEPTLMGDELCMGRPVDYYADICRKMGFEIDEVSFINIQVSYLVSGAIRKVLNSSARKEGQPLSKIAEFSQNISLPITSMLDKVFSSKRDLARITLKRV